MKRFVLFGVLFGVGYGGASWLAMQHASLPAWGLPFEQHVPFVPSTALLYLTIIPALLLAPLILREELEAFATTLCLETLIACAFFVVLPQTTAFHRPPVTGWVAPFFHLADALNLESNQFPSLHVAFACTVAWAYGRRRFRTFWTVWCLLVSASAWLTWEHHLADLLGGALLAAACIRREVLWAEACCVVQCARFSMRHPRYFVIFLAIWLPSLLHWRRTRVVRYAFVTAQWVDDLLDGDRPSKRDPLEIVDELLARRFTRAPLPRLTAALFAELDAAAQDEFLDLIKEMRKDRLRLHQRWDAQQLDEHHRRTFHLSVDLLLITTGCRARAAQVAPLIDALAWCSVFRDLEDDLEKGLINIPSEVV
ncbi:MAG TPA: phosphatase PAP2 family protein, partial [Candidatus Dormibacteraeota bacterium]|nr:phosphatase PAP2 family protein [Candidatus Dormibacteraeota bacterium]